MAIIKEFKAMMFDGEIVGDLSSVTAPHCHAEEQELIEETYGNHPFNVIRLEHPKGEENKYSEAAESLKNWLNTGIVRMDEEPAVYIYRQEFLLNGKHMKNCGIICKVKIEEGVFKPHEETNSFAYSDYKSDRYNLMATTGTVFSSVLALYDDAGNKIGEALDTKAEPQLEFTDLYGVTHSIFALRSEEKIAEIKALFGEKQLVVADGHLRYETAVNYYKKMKDTVVEYSGEEEFNYVMATLMPVTEQCPVINPVHRLLKNKQFNEEETVQKLEKDFEVIKTYIREYDCEKIRLKLDEVKARRPVVMFTGKDYYYLLMPREKTAEDIKTDSELLHKKILGEVFGVNKENFKNYVAYAYSVEEGERAVREEKAICAFYVNPMTPTEMYNLAIEGTLVPKRTNSFYPRLMSGIIMNKFDE